jgi:hypothetical protein
LNPNLITYFDSIEVSHRDAGTVERRRWTAACNVSRNHRFVGIRTLDGMSQTRGWAAVEASEAVPTST